MNRYLNGELMHEDSIKLPDSLRFETLKLKRTVYGGGGIMPDFFVPLDTTEFSDLYKEINRAGVINTFTVSYVDNNRESLKKQYPNFEDFRKNFKVEGTVMDEFWEMTKTEEIEYNETDYQTSKKLITTLIKARIASNLFESSKFYPIFNETENEIFIRALALIEGKTISQLGLDY
jgi:carboxyl-terminal processing protease